MRITDNTDMLSGAPGMQSRFVEIEIAAPYVAVVALARPPVNALGRDIREELLRAFDSLQERADVRTIVLTARGKVFCAGADLKERQVLGSAPGDHLRANRLTREAFFAILDSSKPVIAAVNGAAMGAGFVLAACCDLIFAADSAVFAMPEIDVGMGGGASFLQRILPPSKVRRMMLTGERVPAVGALSPGRGRGVLARCPAAAGGTRRGVGDRRQSPAAVRTIRDSFLTVEGLGLREGFRVEQNYITPLSKTPEAQEARRAFLEKRKPVF